MSVINGSDLEIDGDDANVYNNVNYLESNSSNTLSRTLVLYDVLVPSVGFFVIALNLLVVVSCCIVLRNKGQGSRATYLFLGNLALADLLTGITVVFGQVTPESARDFYLCTLQLGLIVSTTLESVFSVGLIAIDRYLFILHGFQYQRWFKPIVAKTAILLSWAIALTIGFLPMLGWNNYSPGLCWFILIAPKHLVLVTVILGLIPLLVVFVLYGIILYPILTFSKPNGPKSIKLDSMKRNERSFKTMFVQRSEINEEEEKSSETAAGLPGKWKAVGVVLLVTMSFFLTWVPYFVATVLYVFDEDPHSERRKVLGVMLASPLAVLGFLNSLLNPFIYAWWHPGWASRRLAKISKPCTEPEIT